jgi:hypothetical protein
MSESAAAVTPDHHIRTHLGWAVASAMLCFLPTGIVAVVYGLQTQKALARGRPDVAERTSRVGRRWLIVTIVMGVALYLFLAAVFALLGAFST